MKKLVHYLDRLVEYVGAIMMAAMVLIIAWQIFGRYVLHNVPSWSEELVLLLMMWYGFLSISLGFRYQRHLRISFVVDLMPVSVQRLLDKLTHLLTVGFGIVFIIEGYKFTILTWDSTLPATKMPNGIQYLIIPISGVLTLLYGLLWLFEWWGEKKK